MDRMKTFFKYIIWLVGFFILSLLLENGLLYSMYSKIDGELNGYYEVTQNSLSFENISAKACNINGYIKFDLKNTTGYEISKAYMKIDLYNEVGRLADTQYAEIRSLGIDEIQSYNMKFKANNIENFKISIISQKPDLSNIISILGWEFDVTNVFGFDLSNYTIFGVKLTDIFSVEKAKEIGSNAWTSIKLFLARIPWWGYAIGGGIIAWYMPAFYLFGII